MPTSAQRNLIPLSDATVLRGQRAWTRIKTTAAEQRQLWREVGEALLVGRRLHPSNQAFGQWCKEHGFDMNRQDRADAMWLTQNWDALTHDVSTSHPRVIREAHRDLAPAPSADLDLSTPPEAGLERIAKVAPVASKVRKLAAHAAETGPEADTAQRYLAKQAAARGMTVAELVDMANKLDPISGAAAVNRPIIEKAADALVEHTFLAFMSIQHNGLTAEYLIAKLYDRLKAQGA